MLIYFRIIVGAPFEDDSGSIYWCAYRTNQCHPVNFDIHKSAHYSYSDLGGELFGFSLSTLPKEQNRLAVVSKFLVYLLFMSFQDVLLQFSILHPI